MANLSLIPRLTEPAIRQRLRTRFKREFELGDFALKLKTGGYHKFDCVSKDRSVVAEIKSSSSRSTGAKRRVGPGQVKSVIADLYFLSLRQAKHKFLFLTDNEFYKIFISRMRGKIPKEIKVEYFPLNKNSLIKLSRLHKKARKERT